VITERGKIVATIVSAQTGSCCRENQKTGKKQSRGVESGKTKDASRAVMVKGKPVGNIALEERW